MITDTTLGNIVYEFDRHSLIMRQGVLVAVSWLGPEGRAVELGNHPCSDLAPHTQHRLHDAVYDTLPEAQAALDAYRQHLEHDLACRYCGQAAITERHRCDGVLQAAAPDIAAWRAHDEARLQRAYTRRNRLMAEAETGDDMADVDHMLESTGALAECAIPQWIYSRHALAARKGPTTTPASP